MARAETAYVEHPLLVPEAIESRGYQLHLAETALNAHTLVTLPTGLGKTTVTLLVTATRLHQFPDGKALLLAPTKPLVTQHATFYRDALTIPDEDIVVFTGEVRPADRGALWDDARVIVATPQVIENDLIGSRIDFHDVVHITFDECHRATGDYAYTYIAERYHADATQPLVTGLSASPGGDEAAIRTVCENLGITEVEVMTEEDADVSHYAYHTTVEWKRVTLPDEILEIRDRLNAVIEDRLEKLNDLGVTHTTDPNLSESDLQKIRGKLQRLIDNGRSSGYEGMSIHAEIRKLKTAVTYVETQSVESLRRYFERQKSAARSSGASKASQRFVSEPTVQMAMRQASEYDDLHPKFRRARILIAETLGIDGGDRVIVFTESRDTAETLTAFLGEHFATRRFVGQGDKDGSDGMTQREQAEVLDAFRAGEFEVLVSTSVAEEGLDVPEVDLVLFYEPVPTAIRSIQRKGRTGRQTEGRVVVLIAEDTRDEAFFWKAQHSEDRMTDELRALKSMADTLEADLGEQQALDAYDDYDTLPTGETTATNEREGDSQQGLSAFAQDTTEEAVDDPDPPERSGVEVVADQRELDAAIARDLSKRDDLHVRLETLAVGDYVLSDRVVVERKTVRDFLETLVGDRSLFDQIGDMRAHYARPVLIIEGGESLYEERNIHPNAIRGALASLAVDFDASVLWTEDERDTAELLAVIARREQESQAREARVHGEKTAKTLAEQQEYVVSSVAEVGPVTARALLEAFGSVEAVMSAPAEALVEVEGVGEVTAERIREVVATDYDP